MILSRYERMVARRYLLPHKGEGFIFVVAGISLTAVMLGVAALIGLAGFLPELLHLHLPHLHHRHPSALSLPDRVIRVSSPGPDLLL